MKIILTYEEKKQKVRDYIYSNNENTTYFSFESIKNKLDLTDSEIRKILDDLIEEKVIFKRQLKYSIFLPNVDEGRKKLEKFEKSIGSILWMDNVKIIALSTLCVIFSMLLLKFIFPTLANSLAGKGDFMIYLNGYSYGAFLVMVMYLFLEWWLIFLSRLKFEKWILVILSIIFLVVSIILAIINVNILNIALTILSILLSGYQIYQISKEKKKK
jgi:hypothetical protein